MGQSIHIKRFQLFFHRTSVPPAVRSAEVPFAGATKIHGALEKVEIFLSYLAMLGRAQQFKISAVCSCAGRALWDTLTAEKDL